MTGWLSSQLARLGHEVMLGVRGEPHRDHYAVDPQVTVVRLHDRFSDAGMPSAASGKVHEAASGTVLAGVRRAYRAVAFAASVRSLVSRQRPDVVLAIGSQISLVTIAALSGTRTPVVVTERENPFAQATPRAIRRLRPALYARCAVVVVLLESIAERVRQEWGCSHVVVIPNAQMFEPTELVALAERPKVVLSMGRLSQIKGLPSLLQAWQRSEAREHGWRLRIVGEGPQRGELERLITELGIAGSVDMPGSVTQVEAEYQGARVFVLPSRADGFPLALLEAMTFGCTCVATDCTGGPGEMLGHGDAGVLVPVDDAERLSAALDRVTKDEALASALAIAARRRATEFDPEVVMAQWEAVLKRAVTESARRRFAGMPGHRRTGSPP